VAEGKRLFDADFDRKTYTPKRDTFLVSPLNSRASLLELLESAERQLLIYDSRLTDNMMQQVLERRALAGVDVRVIGKVEKRLRGVQVASYAGERLHVRAIVQDDRRAFVGSQSLRRPELDRRREIGVITDDSGIVKGITKIFEAVARRKRAPPGSRRYIPSANQRAQTRAAAGSPALRARSVRVSSSPPRR
jgi:cardiolipin synthase